MSNGLTPEFYRAAQDALDEAALPLAIVPADPEPEDADADADDPLADLSWLRGATPAHVADEADDRGWQLEQTRRETAEIRAQERRGVRVESGNLAPNPSLVSSPLSWGEPVTGDGLVIGPPSQALRGCGCGQCREARENGAEEVDPWVVEEDQRGLRWESRARWSGQGISAEIRDEGLPFARSVEYAPEFPNGIRRPEGRQVYLYGGPMDGSTIEVSGMTGVTVAVPQAPDIRMWASADPLEFAEVDYERATYSYAGDVATPSGSVEVWSPSGRPFTPDEAREAWTRINGPTVEALTSAIRAFADGMAEVARQMGQAFGEALQAARPFLESLARQGVITDPRPSQDARERALEARRARGTGPRVPGPGERLGRARGGSGVRR